MKRVFEKIAAFLGIALMASSALAVKINAPGDINNFAPAVVTVMGTNNAATATALATSRTIALTGDVTGSCSFNGTANCSIASTISGTFNAPTATKLATARTIATQTGDVTSAGASFDGSANETAATTLATTQSAVHTWTSLQTMSGGATISTTLNVGNGTSAFFNMNGAAASNRQISFQSAAVNRWTWFANNTAESGSNAGSDFNIRAFADDGTTIIGVTTITRATANWTFPALILLHGYTVAGLPTCAAGTKGGRAYVTDATAPTFLGTLTGGSTVNTPVFCNGTAWVAG